VNINNGTNGQIPPATATEGTKLGILERAFSSIIFSGFRERGFYITDVVIVETPVASGNPRSGKATVSYRIGTLGVNRSS
jgi:hypothetical protein